MWTIPSIKCSTTSQITRGRSLIRSQPESNPYPISSTQTKISRQVHSQGYLTLALRKAYCSVIRAPLFTRTPKISPLHHRMVPSAFRRKMWRVQWGQCSPNSPATTQLILSSGRSCRRCWLTSWEIKINFLKRSTVLVQENRICSYHQSKLIFMV